MRPKQIIRNWVECFNKNDAKALAEFYAENAVNHQMPNDSVVGKANIEKMFESEFSQVKLTCIVENIYEDGNWAILEWKGPDGMRGCGFFEIKDNKIVIQRGYWDKLTFLRLNKLPLPKE